MTKQSKAAAEQPEATAEALAIEEWATRRGLLPQFLESSSSLFNPPLNPEYWKYAATRAFMGWQSGQQVTEAEFDAAVQAQAQQVYR